MKIQIKSKRSAQWLIMLLVAVLSGCTGIGVPRESGLYAVQGDRVQRLDGSREWETNTWAERSNFNPDVRFMIRNPQLAASHDLSSVIYLRRVGWVRSEINQQGEILPVTGSQWVETGIDELTVPIRLEPHPDSTDVVSVVPQARLERGLYTLQLGSASGRQVNARVGVEWPGVDRRSYAAANCVDRYPGSEVGYRLCADQQQAFASKWLKLHLVKPEIRNLPGQPKELIVKGVVVNTSRHSTRVPMLEARLLTDDGVVVRRWEFNAPSGELQPGASIPFESELRNPPSGASNIHLSFVSHDLRPDNLLASP